MLILLAIIHDSSFTRLGQALPSPFPLRYGPRLPQSGGMGLMRITARIFALVAALMLQGANVSAADLENTLYMDVPAGRVVIEMRPDLAPKHVAQIKELTR